MMKMKQSTAPTRSSDSSTSKMALVVLIVALSCTTVVGFMTHTARRSAIGVTTPHFKQPNLLHDPNHVSHKIRSRDHPGRPRPVATRKASGPPALGMVAYEDLVEKLPSKPVVEAIERQPQKTRVVAADVAAAAGVSLEQARKDLTALASISQGDIAVSSDGDLIYSFPDNLSGVLAQNSIRYKALQAFQKSWPFLFWLVRVSFGVALLASVVAIFSTIFFIQTSSSSDDRDDRGYDSRRGGGGMGFGGGYNYFFGPSPFDFFYYRPYGYYGYYGQPTSPRRSSDDMGFLESIFSYIFGDGNPNAGLEERRLALAANMIRQNQGSVTAEQLAPFCDGTEDPAKVQAKTNVDESFVLPVVTALNGEPRVTDDGDIVYVFPELQTSASSTNKLASTAALVSAEAMTLRRAGLDENSSNRDIKRLLEYNGIGTRGTLERSDLIRVLNDVLPPLSEEEETELLDSDPTVLQEREWKFSLASDLNKFLAGGLGVANLGGALYLGNLFSQLAPLGKLPGWYGTVQAFYPALLAYAILFNVIPLGRNFWIKQQNEKIRQRNKVRKDWKTALASSLRSNSSIQKKLAAAKRMGTELKQVSQDDIVFDTKQSFDDVKEQKGKSDLDEFDKLLESKGPKE